MSLSLNGKVPPRTLPQPVDLVKIIQAAITTGQMEIDRQNRPFLNRVFLHTLPVSLR
jgi:hypothetical protein